MTELAAKLRKHLENAESGETHSGYGNFSATTNERFRNGWSFQPTLHKPSDEKKTSQRVGLESAASTAESEETSDTVDHSSTPGPVEVWPLEFGPLARANGGLVA